MQRARFGEATAIAADTVAGLRVLRGIGGEEHFLERFQAASNEVRRPRCTPRGSAPCSTRCRSRCPGCSSWRSPGWVRGWLSEGELSVGALVAFYGYTAFLVLPLRTITESGTSLDLGARGRRPDDHVAHASSAP